MRRVAFLPVLLVMASVACSASVAALGKRVQAKGRITATSQLPDVVRGPPQAKATQPTIVLPKFDPDPTPIITEFYGPAKVEQKKPEPKPDAPSATASQTAVHAERPSVR